MELVITDSGSIRALSRMIHCASKIGEQLQLSWQSPSTLSLRTINPSHSTYAIFRCHAPFLSSYTAPTSGLSFKLPCRALLPLFRYSQSIVSLRISTAHNCVVFSLHTRNALVKTFRVPLSDGRIGVTAFDKRSVTCTLVTRASLFTDVLANFHARLDEITFSPSAGSMRVASFVDDVSNPANVILRTEMTLAAREFDSYTFAKPNALSLTIFCKYFRAALDFCEPFDAPLRMWYEKSGQPVLFELNVTGASAQVLFDAQFIFASRHAEDDEQPSQNISSPSASATARRPKPRTQLQQMHKSDPTDDMGQRVEGFTDQSPQHPVPSYTPTERGRGRDQEQFTHPRASIIPNANFPKSQDPQPERFIPLRKRSVFDQDINMADGRDDYEDEDDEDFVEGTPPP